MEQNKIYLSVVLSTYNEEKYIAKSIQSILDQTYPYFEFIIVNDGSTDGTLDVIRSFDDPRIIVVDKPNSGLPDSLNKGIEKSKYDWIARMDGDDIAEPTRFENQVKYIDETMGVIGGQFRAIDENDNFRSQNISKKPLTTRECKRWILFGMSPLAHPSVLIRKSLLEKYGGYDVNFKAAQDNELWSRLSPSTSIINIPEVVLKYRKHSNNITSKRQDLQRKLTFMGFLKYVLKIRKPLSVEEFERFETIFTSNGLIEKNARYFETSHSCKGIKRPIFLVLYYAWRLMLFVRLRISYSSYQKQILSL